MKKLLLFVTLVVLTAQINFVSAQCIPDPAIGNAYLFPAVLPFATANVPYSQVVTFRVPLDSDIVLSGLTVHAHVDSAKCILIKGVPQGYTFQCNNSGCVWLGGTMGCALLSGVGDTTKIGVYPIMVYVYTWARLGSVAPFTPYT